MENEPKFRPDQNLKLRDQVCQVLRHYNYASRTEETYCLWIKRYIDYYGGKTHPKKFNEQHIEKYLSHLKQEIKAAPSTQRQALNALMFLYNDVMDVPLAKQFSTSRPKKKRQPPSIMTREETARLLHHMSGKHGLMAKLMYGGGLRLMECVRLRVRDLNIEKGKVFVRGVKKSKNRITLLPDDIKKELSLHLETVTELHQQDIEAGGGRADLPENIPEKHTADDTEIGWQYVFPAKKLSTDPRSGITRRYHVLESGLQKAIKTGAQKAGLKNISSNTFRHSFAVHMLENGVNINVLQKLMGHADIKNTQIYANAVQTNINEIKSPLDNL